jgi:hypothetical protein
MMGLRPSLCIALKEQTKITADHFWKCRLLYTGMRTEHFFLAANGSLIGYVLDRIDDYLPIDRLL